MHQMTRSNIIEVKKNKMMHKIDQLPDDRFESVVDYAVKKRKIAMREYQKEAAVRSNLQREQMVQESEKGVTPKC